MLMRAARGAYAQSIRASLHEIGVDDLPRNGAFVLGEIDFRGGLGQDFASSLGITKQAVSLVIDTLVNRGYLTRSTDSDDRRRNNLELTDSGREVLRATWHATEAVDARLRERASDDEVRAMRAGLAVLAEIKSADRASGAGRRRPGAQLRRFAPIFPVRDLAAALAHYASLGFETSAYEEGDGYGFARRDGVGLHLEAHGDHGHGEHQHENHGHAHGASAYLYVRDADALYEEWSRAGVGGHTEPAEDKPWKVHEGTHTDPDGNLIRFGTPIE
jgi:DNA-binding MarR family transcriptional regulator/uncharacterized glyoxalase superfamily protein PhnB